MAFTRHVVSDAAVLITKTVSSGQQQIVPGEELDYTITYSNTGQADADGGNGHRHAAGQYNGQDE